MTSGHDPDKVDPTNQSGRPLVVTGAVVGLLLALSALLAVYLLSR